MLDSISNELKNSLAKTVDHLREKIKSLRTGRASGGLVENIQVEYYGTKTPLMQLGNINVPEPRMIMIQVYDQNAVDAVAKAIQESDLNLNPQIEGQMIRINLPELTEERRIELAKILDKKIEEAKVAARNIREDSWKTVKDKKQSGGITEDDMYKMQEELNKAVEEVNKEIDELGEKKREEIMTI